jgi:phosphopantothenoylcysteine decarboxylase
MNVLLGVTGSIASTLTSKLQLRLNEEGHNVRTVVTGSAIQFRDKYYDWGHVNIDLDEWETYKRDKTVLHIDLVKWADLFLIAPCTGNTMNKIRSGIADNLLTNCALAWNYSKPMVLAPAMNTQMWDNTKGRKWTIYNPDAKIYFIPPQEKTLYCGDTGLGAMANIEDIVTCVNQYRLGTT